MTKLATNCSVTELVTNWSVTTLVTNCSVAKLATNWSVTTLVTNCSVTKLVTNWSVTRPVRRSLVVDMREVFACENVSNFTSVFAYNQHQVRYFCPRVLQIET
jgi:hypothetical protein